MRQRGQPARLLCTRHAFLRPLIVRRGGCVALVTHGCSAPQRADVAIVRRAVHSRAPQRVDINWQVHVGYHVQTELWAVHVSMGPSSAQQISSRSLFLVNADKTATLARSGDCGSHLSGPASPPAAVGAPGGLDSSWRTHAACRREPRSPATSVAERQACGRQPHPLAGCSGDVCARRCGALGTAAGIGHRHVADVRGERQTCDKVWASEEGGRHGGMNTG